MFCIETYGALNEQKRGKSVFEYNFNWSIIAVFILLSVLLKFQISPFQQKVIISMYKGCFVV